MYSHEFNELLKGTDVEAMKKELMRRGEVISELQDKLRPFQHNQIKLDSKGYLSFGCANGWSESPARDYIMEKCGHRPVRAGGTTGSTTCDDCKWTYWSDSSD